MHWPFEYRFCPRCRGELAPKKIKEAEPERLVCADCGFVFYLDPKLVVCSIVEMEDKIVLLKRKYPPQKGRWVVPGGYVDRGETVETAAVRETREECGLETCIKSLFGIYSYPDYTDVVVFFTAERVSGDLIAGDETQEAFLCDMQDIPWQSLAFRSTLDALRDYCRSRPPGPALSPG